jgi:hypothetical protein
MGNKSRKQPAFGWNPNIGKLKVTKIEIIQREIDTCSDLYFSFGDIVSIHLLIGAAHEILEVFDKKSSGTGMLSKEMGKAIKPEYVDDFRNLVKSPYEGFKHGKADLNAVVELPVRLTEILIISTIEKYKELTKLPTAKMLLLRTWILVQERMLTDEGEQLFKAESLRKRFLPWERGAFKETAYPILKNAL